MMHLHVFEIYLGLFNKIFLNFICNNHCSFHTLCVLLMWKSEPELARPPLTWPRVLAALGFRVAAGEIGEIWDIRERGVGENRD